MLRQNQILRFSKKSKIKKDLNAAIIGCANFTKNDIATSTQ